MFRIIEWDLIKKPKLGGWINTNTEVKYLNADSQTGPPPKRIPWEKTCSRKVQTAVVIDKESQTTYEQATQMWRPDCYIPSITDKYVSPKPYESFDEMRLRLDLDSKAIVIQRCYRAYRFLKCMKECARVYRKLRAECDRLEAEKYQARRERYLKECQVLNDPRTLSDLDAVMSYYERVELGKDTDADLEKYSPRSRGLRHLEEWRRTFLAIDARMRNARQQRLQKTRERFLTRNCRPKRWIGKNGKVVEMLSLRNQAAIECWNLYEQLKERVDDEDNGSRMEVLLKARNSVENHTCKAATILRGLVDQEIILISKSVEQTKIDFLRKRMIGAFLQFARTSHNCTCKCVVVDECIGSSDYEFREPLEKDRLFCISCLKLLSRIKFPVTSRKSHVDKCKACVRLYANVRGHIDLKPYLHILLTIRESERRHGLADCLANALSASDVRHLVLDIWHGHSVVSECSDLMELRLPRYDLNEPWSPWNTIVLTEDEAEAHLCVGGGSKHYAEHLQRKIRLNQSTAKMDFRGLVALQRRIDLEKIDDTQSAAASSTITNSVGVGCDN